MKSIFISLFFSLSTMTAFSQVAVQWNTSFGGVFNERGRSIIATPDDGYLVVGSKNANDGGQSEDIWVMKLSLTGALEWEQIIGEGGQDFAYRVIVADDCSYMVAGMRNSNFVLLKISPDGDLLWERTYGGSSAEYAFDLVQTSDGGFALGGLTSSTNGDVSQSFGGDDGWVIKVDQQGNLLWELSIGDTDQNRIKSIVELENGDLAVAGDILILGGAATQYSIFVSRISASGNLIWTNNYRSGFADRILQSADGNIVVGADFINTTTVSDFNIFKVDLDGNLIWDQVYGGTNRDVFTDLIENANGEFIFTGSSFSDDGDIGNNNGSQDPIIGKLDSQGNLLWLDNFGTANLDWANSVAITEDGGYIVAGWDSELGAAFDQDVTVHKLITDLPETVDPTDFECGGGGTVEICDNGIDDDGDGAIDCADSDLADDCCCRDDLTLSVIDYVACEGETVVVTVQNTNHTGTYSWSFNGLPLPSTTASIQVTEAGNYSVSIMDDCSSASGVSTVSFTAASSVSLPTTHQACIGEIITLRPTTDASSLTWYRDGNLIPGANALWLDVQQSGVYRAVANVGSTCESAAETTVTFTSTSDTRETYFLCEGGTVFVNGFFYNGPGIFIDDANCSSFEIIEIPTVRIENTFTACEDELVNIRGLDYSLPGIYRLTFPDSNGCDTIYDFTIVHLPVTIEEKNLVLSEGTVEFNGVVYDAPGQYLQNRPGVGVCDTACVINVIGGNCLVFYDFDDCYSSVTLGSHDYSEFLPVYPDALSCGTLIATELHRLDPILNRHSCTEGLDGSQAICVSSEQGCDYVDDSNLSGRIRLYVNPDAGREVMLTGISFSQFAPQTYVWSHSSGPNNYPTKYGVRILVEGVEVYKKTDLNTAQTWTEVEFEFEEIDMITLTEESQVEIEILAYCPIGNGSSVSAFDLENLKIYGGCQSTGSRLLFAGHTYLESGEMVENVEVSSFGNDVYRHSMTNGKGEYAFGQSQIETAYMLNAHKDDDHLKGISTLDLIAIQRHILGIELISNQLQRIAADVNDDGKIDGRDLIELRKLILGIYTELPQNDSYRFYERKSVTVSSHGAALEENLFVSPRVDHLFELDFLGTKIGDVISQKLASRSSQSVELEIEDQLITQGETVSIPVKVKEWASLMGMQTTLDIDGSQLRFKGLKNAALNVTGHGAFYEKEDKLSIVWYNHRGIDLSEDDIIFELEFEVEKTGFLSSYLSIDASVDNHEAYLADLQTIPLELNFKTSESNSDFTLYPCNPNPFKNRAVFSFSIPGPSQVHCIIYDINGRVVYKDSGFYEKGKHIVELNRSNLSNGMLFLNVHTKYGSASEKIVLLE